MVNLQHKNCRVEGEDAAADDDEGNDEDWFLKNKNWAQKRGSTGKPVGGYSEQKQQ